MNENVSIILHTCDSYEFCWDGFLHYFKKNFQIDNIKKYFCNEEKKINLDNNWSQLLTGKEEWSNRLIYILNNIKDEYVIYIQEDVWIKDEMDYNFLNSCYQYIKEKNLDVLYICPAEVGNTYSDLFKSDTLLGYDVNGFNENSNYILNHQFGVWRRTSFLENLIEGESPWQNEKIGTQRLIKRGVSDKYKVLNRRWYTSVSRKGKLTTDGILLQNRMN
jgi:hypothetical protein